jgi:hypothetical protein
LSADILLYELGCGNVTHTHTYIDIYVYIVISKISGNGLGNRQLTCTVDTTLHLGSCPVDGRIPTSTPSALSKH